MQTIGDLLTLAAAYDQELPPAPPALEVPSGAQIAGWFDHTLLKPDATAAQVKTVCQEALEYKFASVCISPAYVPLAAGLLAPAGLPVCTVVGFPLGATLPEFKVFETLACINAGASEIDMVINIGALKGAAYGLVLNDVSAVVQTAHNQGALVKVILENGLLTRQEKIMGCLLCKAAGADFVKTATGFGYGGATVEDVALMRRVVGAEMGVKAAGGVRKLAEAQAMILAGANRLGTSAGVTIVQEAAV